jgi:Uncharacterized alpha/beta hydrolase domain (DUF2235)
MAKNIIIFSDGTGQAGGLRPEQRLSNIYKLYRATNIGPDSTIDPKLQAAYYDAGVGSDLDNEVVRLKFLRPFWKYFSSATGTGISRNIADCYEYILKTYEPGDRIYLFGFSRGAYTVRCLGGVLSHCGVPTTDATGEPLTKYGNQIRVLAREAVNEVYLHGAGKGTDKSKDLLDTFTFYHKEPLSASDQKIFDELKRQSEKESVIKEEYRQQRLIKAKRFREKYSSDNNGKPNVVPYFIGVFDTVAALGAKGAIKDLIVSAGLMLYLVLISLLGYLIHLRWSLDFWPAFAYVFLGSSLLCLARYFQVAYREVQDYPEPGKKKWHFANYLKFEFYDKSLNKDVYAARHALAIDESRKDFTRVKWGGGTVSRPDGETEWMKQIWFAGCHSDIGGSYPEDESRLSDVSLKWMLDEALSLPEPILYDPRKLNLFPDPLGLMHSEVFSLQEYTETSFLKWLPKSWRPGWEIRYRIEASGATHHPTVGKRIRATSVSCCGRYSTYAPEALKLETRYPELKNKF